MLRAAGAYSLVLYTPSSGGTTKKHKEISEISRAESTHRVQQTITQERNWMGLLQPASSKHNHWTRSKQSTFVGPEE